MLGLFLHLVQYYAEEKESRDYYYQQLFLVATAFTLTTLFSGACQWVCTSLFQGVAERIKLAIAYDLYYDQMKKLAFHKINDLSTSQILAAGEEPRP